jgi:3-hydroxyacyl-CoA dehydrogenase
MLHVTRNLYDAVPEDEERELFRIPPAIDAVAERGWLGNKAGIGFYKQQRGASGKEFWPLNLQTMEHEPPKKPRFELVGKARKIESLPERLKFIVENAGTDRAGVFLRETMLRTIAYAARRIPEIADGIVDVDRAMRWGFSQQLGPFQVWDALGVRNAADMMREREIAVAPWVDQMLAAGDRIVMNRERLVAEAKKEVLAMAAEGYTPVPAEGEPVYAMGRRGIAAARSVLHGMRVGGYISEYDQKLATALATVMSGGDLTTPQWVTEQYILDLEWQEAAKLTTEPKTQERIMSFLQTGKAVRN